jgi:hypothetical protein
LDRKPHSAESALYTWLKEADGSDSAAGSVVQ